MELPPDAYRAVDVNSRLFLYILLTLFSMISGLTQSVLELSDRLHNLEGTFNDTRGIFMTPTPIQQCEHPSRPSNSH
ncbi:hypothetical protein AZE42_04762 [Rhizopogon vesiculosus]|uniref:Uncharacterized protein n=1 Tax=Rhizopogon vesiculosus TaxID=180088 RepID=A0A1J8PT24_9AGAM|nr:hypothetical protein AZE42_04762 [Rhizopogon vesiculosus]